MKDILLPLVWYYWRFTYPIKFTNYRLYPQKLWNFAKQPHIKYNCEVI